MPYYLHYAATSLRDHSVLFRSLSCDQGMYDFKTTLVLNKTVVLQHQRDTERRRTKKTIILNEYALKMKKGT